MPVFTLANRRLLMRYADSPSYSLNHVAPNASDTAMHSLGKAIASIQADTPETISAVVTHHIAIA